MNPDHLYYLDRPVPPQPESPKPQPKPWTETKVVGKPVQRVDAYERVSGTAQFASDVVLPDMLHAAILHCPHAHARVKSIDTSAAEKMPGVRAVISRSSPGADIPWYRPTSRIFDDHCRFEGEEVAAVAAETPYQAWDAVKAIKVEYEVLPSVSTDEDAAKAGPPFMHGTSNRVGDTQVYERGNVQEGFAAADVVKEMTFRTACEIHVPMEVHGCVAKWDGPRLTIWDSTQGVYATQSGVAQLLKMPAANVRVIGPYMGGGFGSKLSTSKYHIIAALLARSTGRPVKLFLTREQSLLSVGNRPPDTMTIKMGAKKDGTLTAIQMRITGTGGAYAAGGVGSVDFQARDLWLCPNVRTEATDYFVNAGPARAFRAPGMPQGNWAVEQMMDVMAEAIGMDPVEFRLKNVPLVSQNNNNQPYSTTGLKECLIEGAKVFGWAEARKHPNEGVIRRGAGVAAGLWSGGAGGPPATVIVKLLPDGSVNLNMGASDIGCGTKTWAAQIVSEELGVPLDSVKIEHADTGTTQYASPSGGSKTVPTESPAIRAAALDAKGQLLEMAAEQLKVPVGELSLVGQEIVPAKEPAKKIAIGAVQALRRRGLIVGVGYRENNPPGKITRPFGAHFAEVEVNTGTGEVRILRYVAAQDSGRVMNLKTYQNQTFGGVVMGVGLALTEERILDRGQTGKMVNLSFHDYKVPTALDVAPDPVCVPIDLHDDFCSTGAKGLGEPATIPAASAVANAIYDAIRVRATDSPITPSRICQLLAGEKRG
ncbi:MAG: xanthine dehydrogenase family protein molybdopterin-binding subunit [Vicinamibacterales bacterium]